MTVCSHLRLHSAFFSVLILIVFLFMTNCFNSIFFRISRQTFVTSMTWIKFWCPVFWRSELRSWRFVWLFLFFQDGFCLASGLSLCRLETSFNDLPHFLIWHLNALIGDLVAERTNYFVYHYAVQTAGVLMAKLDTHVMHWGTNIAALHSYTFHWWPVPSRPLFLKLCFFIRSKNWACLSAKVCLPSAIATEIHIGIINRRYARATLTYSHTILLHRCLRSFNKGTLRILLYSDMLL